MEYTICSESLPYGGSNSFIKIWPLLPAALTHCRSSNNCTDRARPLQSCCQVLCLIWALRAPLPAWGLPSVPEETQAHRAAGMEQECVLRVAQEGDTCSETQTLPHL